MRKTMVLLATVIMMLVLAFSSNALESTVQCGENVTYTYDSTVGEVVISGTGEMDDFNNSPFKSLKIKSVVIEDGVTSIGNSAFLGCTNLENVVIPNSVTTIDDRAFSVCTSLESIVIPDGVTTIGNSAFSNCDSLESIVIPDSITTIGDFAFRWCYGLQSITVDENNESYSSDEYGVLFNKHKTELLQYPTGNERIKYIIPDSVRVIEEYAFTNCYYLENMIIPNSVMTIGERAFEDCYHLESIVIPNSVTTIGEGAFFGCYGLGSIEISESVTTIGDFVFAYCYGFAGIVIPNGVTSISNSAFSGCTSLESVVIPNSVTTIDDYAFRSCTHLKSIVLPNGVTTIGNYAFDDCISLRSIEIPNSVMTIGSRAFGWCQNLTNVYYSGERYQWDNIEIKNGNDNLINANIHFNSPEEETEHKHSYVYIITKHPTCISAGIKNFTCSCGYSYIETIKATGHKAVTDKAVSATCTKTGITEGSHCSVCKVVIKKQNTVAKKSHTYTTYTTRATLKKNGKTVTKCTECGYASKTSVINKIKSVKLSTVEYIYNGKNKTPSVTVKDSKGKTLKKGTDYTVSYPKKRKNIGQYTVTVTFKGNYSGTKKLTFKIVPAKATFSKLTAGKKKFTATWNTVSGATGYEVAYSTSKKFTKKTTKTVTIKKAKTKKITIKKLTKGKKYYVKVRAFKTVSKKNVYGAYSAVKSVKVK